MEELTSRERFNLALNHQEPDRVPIDLGSITSTIRTVEAYDRLKEYLGVALDKRIRHFADERIVERTRTGHAPPGVSWPGYSEGYAARKYAALGAAPVNLTASCEMLDNVRVVDVSDRHVTLGWLR